MAVRPSRQIMIGSRLTSYELIPNGWIMKLLKFEILAKHPGPTFQIPANNCFENAPSWCFEIPHKMGVWNIEQLPKSKFPVSAIHKII